MLNRVEEISVDGNKVTLSGQNMLTREQLFVESYEVMIHTLLAYFCLEVWMAAEYAEDTRKAAEADFEQYRQHQTFLVGRVHSSADALPLLIVQVGCQLVWNSMEVSTMEVHLHQHNREFNVILQHRPIKNPFAQLTGF